METNRQNSRGDTALMVFSLSPKKETERKSFFGRFKKKLSNHFFELLIDQTAAIANESGVDVIWIDETRQRGKTFAERYANAFKDVFALGYDKVLSIGNDCPELTTDILLDGIHLLNHQELVLGPSTNGGIYLIGFNKAIFDEERFCKLPWLRENLFTTIIQRARNKNIDFHCFKPLSDLNKKATVIQYARRNQGSLISLFVYIYLIFDHFIPGTDQFLSSCLFPGHIYSLRAPPSPY